MPGAVSYLDFDLVISRTEGGYRAQVLSSPAGEASVDFRAPFSDLELENFLLRVGRPRRSTRRRDSPEMQAVRTLGGRLYESVFSGGIRECWVSSLSRAEARNAGLRLRLRIGDAPELNDVPWEYLYNASLNQFLSLSEYTPLIRYLELPRRIRPLTIDARLEILAMISSPSDYPQLDVEQEWSRLNDALMAPIDKNQVRLSRLAEAKLSMLQRELRRSEYHVLHFVGHGGFDQGTQDGALVLHDEAGRGRLVTAERLGTILRDHRSLRLVVLNACEGARSSRTDPFAGVAQTLVQQGIPAVIAMQFEITDKAAVVFAHEFYAAIADDYPVDAALGAARKAIFADENETEWGTPVLFLRAPDGRLFSVNRKARLAEEEKRRAETARQVEEEKRRAEAARQAKEERQRAEAARRAEEEEQRAEAARLAEEEKQRAEAARLAEEEEQRAEAARLAEEEKQRAEAARRAETEKQRTETARRAAAKKRRAEAARSKAEQKRRAEAVRQAEEEKRQAEEARQAEEEKRQAEAARLAEEEKQRAEAARLAEDEKQQPSREHDQARIRKLDGSQFLAWARNELREKFGVNSVLNAQDAGALLQSHGYLIGRSDSTGSYDIFLPSWLRLAEEERQHAEAARLAEEERQRATAARLAEEAKQRAEVARLAEEEKQRAEAARLAKEEKQQPSREHDQARIRKLDGYQFLTWARNELREKFGVNSVLNERDAGALLQSHGYSIGRSGSTGSYDIFLPSWLRLAEEERQHAEAARLAEEERQRAEAARLADEKRQAEAPKRRWILSRGLFTEKRRGS